jgi:catechol 2,3-dioxygenase-like lactoylglutathione lyase family enzyme
MTPPLADIDHIHVHVSDRAAAETWYGGVLGLHRDPALGFWMRDGGPMVVRNDAGTVHLSLFERPLLEGRTTIAFRVSGPAFLVWRQFLRERLPTPADPVDHDVSWSLYFRDPDGNPFEITSYEYEAVRDGLRRCLVPGDAD